MSYKIILRLPLQAAERHEPTDLLRQRQRQRQGQRCRRQQDRDQPGHAPVPHGTNTVTVQMHGTDEAQETGSESLPSNVSLSFKFDILN